MKKILFLLAMLPMMFACSSSDDEEEYLDFTASDLVGKWSTGTSGVHKYLEFESNGEGYYSLFSGADIISNYVFDYKVSDNEICIYNTYPDNGSPYILKALYSTNKLKILEGEEKGTYSRIK